MRSGRAVAAAALRLRADLRVAVDDDTIGALVEGQRAPDGFAAALIDALHRGPGGQIVFIGAEKRQVGAGRLAPALLPEAHASIGRALALMGRLDEAIQSFERALALGGGVPSTVAAMGQVLALAGKEKAARKCLRDLETMARTRYIPSSCFAILHMGLGETSKSLD